MKATDVMTPDVVSIGPETSVRHIAQLMLRHRVSALPVLDDDGRLVGIVSEGDLMRRGELGRDQHRSWWLNLFAGPEEIATEYVKQHGQRAKDVMTSRVVSIDEHASVATIAAILEEKRVKRLPVLRDGRLIGIVSRAICCMRLQPRGSTSVRRVTMRYGERSSRVSGTRQACATQR
jgi:CBS domain-containing protein